MIVKGAHVFFLAGALALAACGKDDDSDDVGDAGRNLARAPGLQGAWASTCDAFGPLDLSGKAFYAFQGNKYQKKITVHSDDQCATQTAEIRYVGEFKVGNGDDLANGLNRVDLTPKSVSVKATTEDGARALNAARLCGIIDWKVDQARDVAAAARQGDCIGERIDAVQYDVYGISDKALKFGSAYLLGAPIRAESRPARLNERVFQPTDKWE